MGDSIACLVLEGRGEFFFLFTHVDPPCYFDIFFDNLILVVVQYGTEATVYESSKTEGAGANS
jgi:hypothetical protein